MRHLQIPLKTRILMYCLQAAAPGSLTFSTLANLYFLFDILIFEEFYCDSQTSGVKGSEITTSK